MHFNLKWLIDCVGSLLLGALRSGRSDVLPDIGLKSMQRVSRLFDHAGTKSRTSDSVQGFLTSRSSTSGMTFYHPKRIEG